MSDLTSKEMFYKRISGESAEEAAQETFEWACEVRCLWCEDGPPKLSSENGYVHEVQNYYAPSPYGSIIPTNKRTEPCKASDLREAWESK